MMVSSFIIMLILSMAGLLYLYSSGSSEGESDIANLDFTFENSDYLFYLTDGEIASAIQESRESIRLIEDYLIELNDTGIPEIAFVYMEPPILTAKLEARRISDHFGRTASVPEIKEGLSDRYLPVIGRFTGNHAFVFDVSLHQETDGEDLHEVQFYEENSGGGAVKTILIDMETVDPSIPLYMDVFDVSDPALTARYRIDFETFQTHD
ncbi:hypothetical protein Bsel_1213 [[Bacillus] selenitireducens MLS10]|uniref:Uncharacterized protein n=2 Tax=Salisediminibacterium selenitireducens TaxID=85683 RepID=D6XSE0_BACIE|nr:hypothetical protein Bsel_1213 [[Bacillus] selenitireducens MLS10]